jgi:hypothetical protein
MVALVRDEGVAGSNLVMLVKIICNGVTNWVMCLSGNAPCLSTRSGGMYARGVAGQTEGGEGGGSGRFTRRE